VTYVRQCDSPVDLEGRATDRPELAVDSCLWVDGSERLVDVEAPPGVWRCPNCGGGVFELVDADDAWVERQFWDQRVLERDRR
jgi:hypothetical protein